VRLEPELLAQVQAIARERDETVSQVIRRALRAYVESGGSIVAPSLSPAGSPFVEFSPELAPTISLTGIVVRQSRPPKNRS
jgi:hypothetical protein